MRAWISYEEKEETLLRAQVGFPHLFTDKQEEGKTGPFPLSHLRRLSELYTKKEEHEFTCNHDIEENGPCLDCRDYANLPEFSVPHICFRHDRAEVPREISDQLDLILDGTPRGETMSLTYFPEQLIDIQYQGTTYFLGEVNIFDVTIYMKDAVFIDE